MFSRRAWGLGLPLAAMLATLAFTGSASAATTSLGCRASVARVSLLSGAPAVEPYVANPSDAPCAADSAGVGPGGILNLGGLGGVANGAVTVGPAQAQTNSVNDGTDLGASSLVSVDAVSIPTPAGAISIVGPAQATAAYECSGHALQATASSTLKVIQIGGQSIALPANGAPGTVPLTGVLGGTITVNQNTVTATSDTEQLLTVHLPGVADVVIGEARVDRPASNACANVPGNPGGGSGNPGGGSGNPGGGSGNPGRGSGNPGGGSGNPGGGSGNPGGNPGGGGTTTLSSVCPVGTTLLPSTGLCEIITSGSGSAAKGIAVSAPNSHQIVGGSVMSLVRARKLYGGRTACLNGAGPKYIVVGTRRHDRITVGKVRLRVLGLAGNDRITVKGGNRTCVNGGAGNDTIVNKGRNRVTVFGANGNDRITLGNGPAFVLGGYGKDRIVAGNGKVNLQGNRGNDYIRAGNGADRLNGGDGNDTLIAGTGVDRLTGGPGNNRLTAHGRKVFAQASKGRSVAYLRKANRSYAKHHGIRTVHVIKS